MSGRAARAYAMVAASYLIIGLSGTLVTWATAPGSALLVLRFAIAALAVGAVFARRRRLAGVLQRDVWPRLLLMGAFDAIALLLYFVAIRETSVAIATFFLFVQPVWIALLAPRLIHSPTERVVYVAIGLALAGLAIILVPALSGDGLHASVLGLVAGLLSGFSVRRLRAGREVPLGAGGRRNHGPVGVHARLPVPVASCAVADAGRRLLAHGS